MSFWAKLYSAAAHIEALLNNEDVTLQEVMDYEDLLQECRMQHKKLVEFLIRSDVMEELINLITKEPSTEIEERFRYKYPNIACELLTCGIPTMNEKLAGDEALLGKLYSFIDTDEPLNPLLASFFNRTMTVLLSRKSNQVLEFLKSQVTCVTLLLQHLETSAIMDLILKLVTQIEGDDTRNNTLSWLDSEKLVQRLVKLLSPTSEHSKHANAAQSLCDMITRTRENRRAMTTRDEPDPILTTLESDETVSLLLETILTGDKLESSIVGGIQVLLALLGQKPGWMPENGKNEEDVNTNGADKDVDSEQHMKISNAIVPYLEQLQKLLIDPPYKPPVKTTAGVLDCPVGNTRLHVAKLIVALLCTKNVKIYETLVDLGTFQTLLDLFFKYKWNNFLHTQVQQCLALTVSCDFEDKNNIIYANIFIKCKLIERILEAWDTKDKKENAENGVKQGYMGHLINIANNIVSQREKSEALSKFMKENLSSETLSEWENLVFTQLVKINITHQLVLGGQIQEHVTNSEGGQDQYHSYSEDAYLQQMYSSYQEQEIAPQMIEDFGHHDDQFNDGEGALYNVAKEGASLAFMIPEGNLDRFEYMFDKLCQQKQKAGLEDCGGGVEWGDDGEHTFQTVVEKRDWPTKQQQNDSNSSDEEDDDPRDMYANSDRKPADSKYFPFQPSVPPSTVLPEVNPWEAPSSDSAEPTGWANFDNFDSSLSIESPVILESKPSPSEVFSKDVPNEECPAPVSVLQEVSTISTVITETPQADVVAVTPTLTLTVTDIVTDTCQNKEEAIVPESKVPENPSSGGGDTLTNREAVCKTSIPSTEGSLDNKKAGDTICTEETPGTDANANPGSSDIPVDRVSDAKTVECTKSSGDCDKSAGELCITSCEKEQCQRKMPNETTIPTTRHGNSK